MTILSHDTEFIQLERKKETRYVLDEDKLKKTPAIHSEINCNKRRVLKICDPIFRKLYKRRCFCFVCNNDSLHANLHEFA